MPHPTKRVERSCRQCGAAFTIPRSHAERGEGVYCSRECFARYDRERRVPHSCQTCGYVFSLSPGNARDRAGRYCSYDCYDQGRKAETDRRFWSRLVKTTGDAGCWEWKGARNRHGYGVVARRQGSGLAHRRAWEIANGIIPDGMFVLHRCDNPACCRPEHLFLGTQAENVADMTAKGRRVALRGEAHGRAKLSDQDIAHIREQYAQGMTQVALATEYGVAQAYVSRIVRGTARATQA